MPNRTEYISFTIATLEHLLANPQELPRIGHFPVLQARFANGKITAGYIVTASKQVPGGVIFSFERMQDGERFTGFYNQAVRTVNLFTTVDNDE